MTHTDYWSVWPIQITNPYDSYGQSVWFIRIDNPYESYGSTIYIGHTDCWSVRGFFFLLKMPFFLTTNNNKPPKWFKTSTIFNKITPTNNNKPNTNNIERETRELTCSGRGSSHQHEEATAGEEAGGQNEGEKTTVTNKEKSHLRGGENWKGEVEA